ncbi:MAG: hypothetical protein AB7F36_10055 [Reyranellaceae bacterium]
MRIVDKRTFLGANCLLPVPAIGLVVDPGSDMAEIDQLRFGQAVRDVNFAIEALDNAFTPARMTPLSFGRSSGSGIGDFVAELALVLQRQFVCSAQQSRVVHRAPTGLTTIAYECRHPRLGLLAGSCAVGICTAIFSAALGAERSLVAMIEEFKNAASGVVPALETRLLLLEADRRGIPWFRLAENIPVVQLGEGNKRRRFRNSLTDETGDTAYRLASFKPLGAHLMHELGLPVPLQGIVETEEQAVTLGRKLGFPVVVKPVGMDMGVGVRVGIANEAELRAAYRDSRAHGQIQVEQHLAGFDYRFTFIRGRLIGVVRTSPPVIEGDGRSTIRQLIEAEAASVATEVRKKVIVDEEVLGRVAASGYAMDDVLPAGDRIVLRLWWRNKPDHTLANVTAETHPENIDAAFLAVQAVGLDVAGVDYITTDISRPYHETGGAFTEVNPMPAMAGVQRAGISAYPMLLQALFPDGDTGRIDTVVVLGAHGAEPVAASIERVLSQTGHQVGVATRERFDVAGQKIRRHTDSDAERGRTILRHPRATASVLQTTQEAIANEGLALERCSVGVLLMPDPVLPETHEGSYEAAVAAAKLLCEVADRIIVMDVQDPRAPDVVSVTSEGRVIWTDFASDRPGPSPRRPGDTLFVARLDGRKCSIIVDDGQGLRALATIERPAIGDVAADPRTCRVWLMALAAAVGLGVAPTAAAAAVMG